MLSCAASELSAQCTEEALKHVVSMLTIWVQKFDQSCSISGYDDRMKERKEDDDFSFDSGPTHISIDQTISPPNSSIIKQTATPSSLLDPESDSTLSKSSSEVTTGNTNLPEFEFESKLQPESTSTSDVKFVSNWKEGKPSTVPPVPESTNTENDSAPSVRSSFNSSSKFKSVAAADAKKSKMQGIVPFPNLFKESHFLEKNFFLIHFSNSSISIILFHFFYMKYLI